jgi:transcriptional repressor NrdR
MASILRPGPTLVKVFLARVVCLRPDLLHCFGASVCQRRRRFRYRSMKCPYCREDNDKVIDTAAVEDGAIIRRRRECLACQRRFTTYERIEQHPIKVIKKDGRRVPFDRSRIRVGLEKACEKRPVSGQAIDALVGEVENEIYQTGETEVTTQTIGELVMKRLRQLDPVAYVRFASVYREFKDASDFVEEVEPLLGDSSKA